MNPMLEAFTVVRMSVGALVRMRKNEDAAVAYIGQQLPAGLGPEAKMFARELALIVVGTANAVLREQDSDDGR
jgi:hypothetical protein